MDWPIVNLLFKWQCSCYIVYKFGELASNILGVFAVKTRNFCRNLPTI